MAAFTCVIALRRATPPYYVQSHPSMSAKEIEYGWKINSALEELFPSKAIDLFSRDAGMNYSAVIDASRNFLQRVRLR